MTEEVTESSGTSPTMDLNTTQDDFKPSLRSHCRPKKQVSTKRKSNRKGKNKTIQEMMKVNTKSSSQPLAPSCETCSTATSEDSQDEAHHCPVCNNNVPLSEMSSHISSCLKTFEKKSSEKSEIENIFCEICRVDITHMNIQSRAEHVNKCIDSQEIKSKSTTHSDGEREHAVTLFQCPLCGKNFQTSVSRLSHIKPCAQKLNLDFNQIVAAFHLHEKHQQERFEIGLPPLQQKKSSSTDEGRPKRTKGKFIRQPKSKNESDLQMAMALSASLKEEQERNENWNLDTECSSSSSVGGTRQTKASVVPCLRHPESYQMPGNKGASRKKKDKNKSVPTLLLRTEEERKKLLQERVEAIVTFVPRSPEPLTLSDAESEEASDMEVENPTAEVKASTTKMEESNFQSRIANMSIKDCPLWSLASLTEEKKDAFYAPELRHVISPTKVSIEHKLRRLSQIPGYKITSPPEPPSSQSWCSPCDKTTNDMRKNSQMPSEVQLKDTQTVDEKFPSPKKLLENGFVASSPVKIYFDKDSDKGDGFFTQLSKENRISDQQELGINILLKDLKGLVGNPWMSDVSIHVSGQTIIPAHKLLLKLRCLEISKELDLIENGVSQLYWVDVTAQAALSFLKYIYTGIVQLDKKIYSEIQQLAARYKVLELLQLISDFSRKGDDPNFHLTGLPDREDLRSKTISHTERSSTLNSIDGSPNVSDSEVKVAAIRCSNISSPANSDDLQPKRQQSQIMCQQSDLDDSVLSCVAELLEEECELPDISSENCKHSSSDTRETVMGNMSKYSFSVASESKDTKENVDNSYSLATCSELNIEEKCSLSLPKNNVKGHCLETENYSLSYRSNRSFKSEIQDDLNTTEHSEYSPDKMNASHNSKNCKNECISCSSPELFEQDSDRYCSTVSPKNKDICLSVSKCKANGHKLFSSHLSLENLDLSLFKTSRKGHFFCDSEKSPMKVYEQQGRGTPVSHKLGQKNDSISSSKISITHDLSKTPVKPNSHGKCSLPQNKDHLPPSSPKSLSPSPLKCVSSPSHNVRRQLYFQENSCNYKSVKEDYPCSEQAKSPCSPHTYTDAANSPDCPQIVAEPAKSPSNSQMYSEVAKSPVILHLYSESTKSPVSPQIYSRRVELKRHKSIIKDRSPSSERSSDGGAIKDVNSSPTSSSDGHKDSDLLHPQNHKSIGTEELCSTGSPEENSFVGKFPNTAAKGACFSQKVLACVVEDQSTSPTIKKCIASKVPCSALHSSPAHESYPPKDIDLKGNILNDTPFKSSSEINAHNIESFDHLAGDRFLETYSSKSEEVSLLCTPKKCPSQKRKYRSASNSCKSKRIKHISGDSEMSCPDSSSSRKHFHTRSACKQKQSETETNGVNSFNNSWDNNPDFQSEVWDAFHDEGFTEEFGYQNNTDCAEYFTAGSSTGKSSNISTNSSTPLSQRTIQKSSPKIDTCHNTSGNSKRDTQKLSSLVSEPVKTLKQKGTIKNRRKKEVKSTSPITPLPDYQNMKTPVLKVLLRKVGVKHLPRKKAVNVLTHIYEVTHPWETESDDESSTNQKNSKVHNRRICEKQKQKILQANKEKTFRDKDQIVTHRGKLSSKSLKKTSKVNKKLQKSSSKEFDSESEISSSQMSSHSYLMDESVTESDNRKDVQSSSSQLQGQDLRDSLMSFFTSNATLYEKVLMYEPLNLQSLHQDVKDAKLKVSLEAVKDFLDAECIAFSFPRNEKFRKKQQRRNEKFRQRVRAKIANEQCS